VGTLLEELVDVSHVNDYDESERVRYIYIYVCRESERERVRDGRMGRTGREDI